MASLVVLWATWVVMASVDKMAKHGRYFSGAAGYLTCAQVRRYTKSCRQLAIDIIFQLFYIPVTVKSCFYLKNVLKVLAGGC